MSFSDPSYRSIPVAGPHRPSWAGPLFVVGLGCLIWALLGHSSPEERRARRFQRELDQARHLLHSKTEDHSESVVHLVRQVLNQMEPAHPLAGEAWFLCGSALLAEYRKATDNLKEGLLAESVQAFERAKEAGVKEHDAPTLEWFRALAVWNGGKDPKAALELLEKAAQGAEDQAAAWQLIEDGYLKLSPPDLAGALRANEQIRSTPLILEERRAQAQMEGGEILMKLGQVEEARRTLEKISPRASAEIFQKARWLLARSFHDESRWAEAAQQWQRYLTESKPTPADAAVAFLLLGQCQFKLEQYPEASRAWQEARKLPASEATQAASVYWAELRSEDAATDNQAPAALLAAFEEAFRICGPGKVWSNAWCDQGAVRLAMEKTLVNLRKAAQFDSALKVAELYAQVAQPGMALQWKAEILNDTALFQLHQAAGADLNAKRELSRKLLQESALALEGSAREIPDTKQRTEQIWKASQRAQDAKDPALGTRLLMEFVRLEPKGEKTGEAWYYLGEAHRELAHADLAVEAYRESLKFMTPFAYRARFRLAVDMLNAKQIDRAIETLEQNIQLLRFNPDSEAHKDSLYLLGELLGRQNQWRSCVRRLEEALEKYPNNSGSMGARLTLALGYNRLAEEDFKSSRTENLISPETRSHFEKQHKVWREKALETYLDVERQMALPENQAQVTNELRAHLSLAIAETQCEMGKWDEALAAYSALAKKYAGTREGLQAKGGVVRVLSAKRQFDLMNREIEELKVALQSVDEPTRREWQAWIDKATRIRFSGNQARSGR